MPVRRSHRKSRNGCLCCKQRRVKCDEAGPPCGNCRARSTECHYASSETSSQGSPAYSVANTVDTTASPLVDFSTFPSSHQLIELQLMHRWSTRTYQSISSGIVKDHVAWQEAVPELALRYDFLLNGLLAVSAFDIAASEGPSSGRYVSAALEYQQLAIQSFQTQLSNTTQESQDASLYFSIILMILSLASSQFASNDGGPETMIHNTIAHFQLVRGIGVLMFRSKDTVREHPLFRSMRPIHELQGSPIDPTLQSYLGKLYVLNDKRAESKFDVAEGSSTQASQTALSCVKALRWLHKCFEICVDFGFGDYCLGWPCLAGQSYINAVQEKDVVALLILMYWGILVDRLGSDFWWAKNFGKSLISEISRIVPHHIDLVAHEAVVWAQEQVSVNVDRNVS